MTEIEAKELRLGVYRIYWRSGGSSVASIYQKEDGTRMLAPSNWVEPGNLLEQSCRISRVTELGRVEQEEVSKAKKGFEGRGLPKSCTSCAACVYGDSFSLDGFDRGRVLTCGHADGRVLDSFYEHPGNEAADKGIATWCPLKKLC